MSLATRVVSRIIRLVPAINPGPARVVVISYRIVFDIVNISILTSQYYLGPALPVQSEPVSGSWMF